MRRKKVLLITAYFPPVGGGGVMRALKMAKYLGEFGCDLWVLSKVPRHNDILDPSLLAEVPPSVRVVRTRDVDPYRWLYRLRPPVGAGVQAAETVARPPLLKRAGTAALGHLKPLALKLLQYTAIPDEFYWWARAAVPPGEKIIRREGIEVVFSTSHPYSVHLLGYWLKKRTGALWIADFRDPWTQNIHRSGIPWRERIEERMERRVMTGADAVTTVTPSFAAGFRAKYGNAIKRLEVIYNGFDPADYSSLAPAPHDGRFTAAYAGILYEKRSPRALLEAVAELLTEGTVRREEIRLRFAGSFDTPGSTTHYELVRRLGLEDVVEIMGKLPHREALAVLKGADLLLLIGDAVPEAEAYIPGKLYEYMAVGRPVLALVAPGEAERIVGECRLGRVVHPADKEGIKQAYREMYRAWKEGRLPRLTEMTAAKFNIYNRRYQAGQLAQLMEELLAGRTGKEPPR
ncbi:MAG: glycosyltransferase family 4 protein [Bacillota bacterium]